MSEDSTKNAGGGPPEKRRPLELVRAANKPQEDATPQQDSERSGKYQQKKSWWRRFLAGEPPDPRKGQREIIPGLVAYFFTGGAPVAHPVLNISRDGLYVLTNERWYPDTLIRITLSDEREPSSEMSLTAHARVARSGSDGVGLEFVFPSTNKGARRGLAEVHLDSVDGATAERIEQFIKRFKSRP